MIDILYCPDHTPKIVVAAGEGLVGAKHVHADETKHTCLLETGIDEDNPLSWPHTARDETVIVDANAWHLHLAQYIP